MTRIALICLLLASSSYAGAETSALSGKVIAILNGNTFQLKLDDGSTSTVKLVGIECPEKGQPFFEDATKCLEKLLLNKKADLEVVGKDRCGAYLANIHSAPISPQIKLVSEGLAWVPDKEAASEQLLLTNKEAQETRKGIWSESNPTPPWIYRRNQCMELPKSS